MRMAMSRLAVFHVWCIGFAYSTSHLVTPLFRTALFIAASLLYATQVTLRTNSSCHCASTFLP